MGMTVAMSHSPGACSCPSENGAMVMKVSRTANTTIEVEMARLVRHRCMRSFSSSRAAAWEIYHDERKQKRRYLVEAAALFEPSQRMLPIEDPTVNEGAIVRLDEFVVAADETVEPHTILLHQPLAKKIQFERHEKHRRDQIEQYTRKKYHDDHQRAQQRTERALQRRRQRGFERGLERRKCIEPAAPHQHDIADAEMIDFHVDQGGEEKDVHPQLFAGVAVFGNASTDVHGAGGRRPAPEPLQRGPFGGGGRSRLNHQPAMPPTAQPTRLPKIGTTVPSTAPPTQPPSPPGSYVPHDFRRHLG